MSCPDCGCNVQIVDSHGAKCANCGRRLGPRREYKPINWGDPSKRKGSRK